MLCKYLSKTFQNGFKCKLHKSNISISDCNKNCPDFILKRNKGIKKVNKKRIFVTDETYQKVFERDNGRCQLCGTSKELQLHHIVYRSERKDLINEPNNCIMLCLMCHKKVHSNKHKWQPILIEKVKEKENENNRRNNDF